jgi:flagellar motor switch protein FliM
MSDGILTDEEIDALLVGVSKGDIETNDDKSDEPVSVFDFSQQHNIVISRLPKLETITNQFVKGMRKKLLDGYKNEVDVQLAYLHTRRFYEYRKSLPNPSNLNLITVSPYGQAGLIILDSKLLFILVDQYFGGTGELAGRVETKSFSPIELKTSEQFIELIIEEWRRAWEKSALMSLSVNGREDNPSVVQMMGMNDVVFQIVIQVGFNGNYGEFQVAIPYSILESLRDELGPEIPSQEGSEDEKWRESLFREISVAEVSVSSSIDNLSITLQELIELSPGDVVPIEMPESIRLYVEGLPVFEGRLGAFNGKNAIQVERDYVHTRRVKTATKFLG